MAEGFCAKVLGMVRWCHGFDIPASAGLPAPQKLAFISSTFCDQGHGRPKDGQFSICTLFRLPAIFRQVVESWDVPIDAPQNMFIVSIPTVLDPLLAPEGKHLVHIYTAGNEPYKLWEGMKRGSPEYEVRRRAGQLSTTIFADGCWLPVLL